MKSVIKVILVIAFPLFTQAQQSRVDSIVSLLQKIDIEKAIDTAQFTLLINAIENTALDDSSIATLEKVAEQLTLGENIFWNYYVKRGVQLSLNKSDKVKAIAYGKRTYESLQTSKSLLAINIRSNFLKLLRIPYRTSDKLDEGFKYFNEKLREFQIKKDTVGLADCYYVLSGFYRTKGLMSQAIYNMKKSVSYLSPNSTDKPDFYSFEFTGINQWRNNYSVIGSYYFLDGNYLESVKYSEVIFDANKKSGNAFQGNVATFIALSKLMSGSTDSVEYFINNVLSDTAKRSKDGIAFALQAKALFEIKTDRLEQAEKTIQYCWQIIRQNNISANSPSGVLHPDYFLSLVREKQNRIPEAITLLKMDLERLKGSRKEILDDYKLLAQLYEREGDFREANYYHNSFIDLQDSLLQDQKIYASLSFETEQQINQSEIAISKLESETKLSKQSRNFTIGIAALLLILASSIYYRFQSKKKANRILERTLSDLKSTQAQLIQSEKMASLGELTAGIAHEIQNPLNFVNNFSEVNEELIKEMVDEVGKGNIEEVKILASDIKGNSEKISQHGQRAAAIVKGMLQHSRSSSGQKESTDINVLCEEYLRLAYHGLRAKDKSFNATMKTEFDASLPKINVVPQDVGRVILNLINNAFYAASQPSEGGLSDSDNNKTPTIWVSTMQEANKVLISVRDNGNGIPEKIKDKIFQPFFTTKPTGSGTGLGLSLSYDIVKAHGGEIKVESREGEGTKFVIQLPVV